MPLTRYLDGYDVRAQVYLERQTHKGAFLLVEGETDDKALAKFVDSTACSIIVASGKRNALQAMDLLEEDGFDRAFCVIDADFDRIKGTPPSSESISMTDCHDMDLTIFSTPALDNYLREHCDREKLATFSTLYGCDVRDKVLHAAEPVARVRWLNEDKDLRLNFKRLTYTFINRETLACDEPAMVDELLAASPYARCQRARLVSLMDAARNHAKDLLQLCNGHDVAAIVGITLRHILSDRRDMHTWASEIEAGLRLAFDREAFSSTGIYRNLKAWSAARPRCGCLRG
jgi:hypothetical protein